MYNRIIKRKEVINVKKYYIDNEITGRQLPIVFNTHERAKAFIKKHHFFGSITTIKDNENIKRKEIKI